MGVFRKALEGAQRMHPHAPVGLAEQGREQRGDALQYGGL